MALVLTSCSISKRYDIYERIPIGTNLTMEILQKAEQVTWSNRHWILVYDLSDTFDTYDPHLLFFDQDLKLASACYFLGGRVITISSDTIFAYRNEHRQQRESWHRNDLPPGYILGYQDFDGGSGRQSNKIIDNIEFDSSGFCVKFQLRESDDLYVGLDWDANSNVPLQSDSYIHTDSLEYLISELRLSYEGRKVTVTIPVWFGAPFARIAVSDQMIVHDQATWDKFYLDLMEVLQSRSLRHAPMPLQ